MIDLSTTLYWGETFHDRRGSVRHRFTYPLMFVCIELSSLRKLRTKLLRYNRPSLFSLYDDDYLKGRNGALEEKLHAFLKEQTFARMPTSTYLITVPRCIGYVFNPVNFYISVDANNALHSLIAEVSNTFGEVHTYVLDATKASEQEGKYHFTFPKEFYVSPFLDSAGEYHLSLSAKEKKLLLSITLTDKKSGESPQFHASMTGKARALSDASLALTLMAFPLSCVLTMARIHWQAFLLIGKKVRIFHKPAPANQHTHTYASSWIYTWRQWILKRF